MYYRMSQNCPIYSLSFDGVEDWHMIINTRGDDGVSRAGEETLFSTITIDEVASMLPMV